jgi:NADH-quinone oxidoreductase subunit C
MSEEQKENGNKEPAANQADNTEASSAPVAAAAPKAPANASPETAAKAPAAPAAKTDEVPAIEPGEFGKALEKAKIPVKHLGKDATGLEMIDIAPADLLKAGAFLRDDCGFDLLLSCAAVDWKDRLESVYHFYSTTKFVYLTVKVTANENGHSPSLMPIWHAADWHEREAYDLMGIHYDGHTNLTRILMPNDWLGHPLRKDYKMDDPRLVWNER